MQRPSTQRRLRGVSAQERRAQLGSRVEASRRSAAVDAPPSPTTLGPGPVDEFDISRLRALEPEPPYVRPARSRRRMLRLSAVFMWGGGLLILLAALSIAAMGAQRWFGADAPASGAALPSTAPALPEFTLEGAPGSAAHAQSLVRVRAQAFAGCVARKGSRESASTDAAASLSGLTTPPPYARCDSGRAIGIDPAEVSRRGAHGPIDGRGARSGLGLFTVHGGREAWLLQYDATGTGWGYSFDARGNVEAQCRTRKGRLCWDLENDPAGALFLGDDATVSALAAMLASGRDGR